MSLPVRFGKALLSVFVCFFRKNAKHFVKNPHIFGTGPAILENTDPHVSGTFLAGQNSKLLKNQFQEKVYFNEPHLTSTNPFNRYLLIF